MINRRLTNHPFWVATEVQRELCVRTCAPAHVHGCTCTSDTQVWLRAHARLHTVHSPESSLLCSPALSLLLLLLSLLLCVSIITIIIIIINVIIIIIAVIIILMGGVEGNTKGPDDAGRLAQRCRKPTFFRDGVFYHFICCFFAWARVWTYPESRSSASSPVLLELFDGFSHWPAHVYSHWRASVRCFPGGKTTKP